MILLSDVTADENPEHKGTNQGYDADDKVFLLSIKEVEKYFNSDKDRGCKPTRHAICNGVLIDEDKGQCWWWLRSLGYYSIVLQMSLPLVRCTTMVAVLATVFLLYAPLYGSILNPKSCNFPINPCGIP